MTNTKDTACRRSLADIVQQVGEIETIRPAFEAWITSYPYEREIKRWPKDETEYAWQEGQYCDITTQLAWEAWQESAFVHKLPSAPRQESLPKNQPTNKNER
jgi:hypothetical protein